MRATAPKRSAIKVAGGRLKSERIKPQKSFP